MIASWNGLADGRLVDENLLKWSESGLLFSGNNRFLDVLVKCVRSPSVPTLIVPSFNDVLFLLPKSIASESVDKKNFPPGPFGFTAFAIILVFEILSDISS